MLSPKQKELIDWIQSVPQQTKTYLPTIRTIMKGMGYKSVNSVSQHLKLLEKKGYIQKDGRKYILVQKSIDNEQ